MAGPESVISPNFNQQSGMWERSIGPELMNGAKTVVGFVADTASYLTNAFMATDPTAQKWMQAGVGFIGGAIACNILSKMPGFGILGNEISKLVMGAGAAILLSSMRVGAAELPQQPVIPDNTAEISETVTTPERPVTSYTVPGIGGP